MKTNNDQGTETTKLEASSKAEPEGFFKRIFTRMDDAIKAKAEAGSNENCCSGDSGDSKGGKCC